MIPDPLAILQTLKTHPPQQAVIVEALCIGCVKCISACPVDAIVGTSKQMHTILPDACIGCGLCVAPCPMDCIVLQETNTPLPNEATLLQRMETKQHRLLRAQQQAEAQHQQKRLLAMQTADAQAQRRAKQAYLLQVMQRKRLLPAESS